MSKNPVVPVFFCIPDLTGYTKFITSTDAEFANKVIPMLLSRIISCDILNMSVAEIEGDAIFFYREGRLPAIQLVAKQCEMIFETFSSVIESFRKSDPENFDKYLADNQLGIKVIIHYGKITLIRIKGRTKLLGEDVILAHKLLKNSVKEPNYILLTDRYIDKLKDKKVVKQWFNWESLKRGADKYEHFGLIRYSYVTIFDCNNLSKRKPLSLKSLAHK